MLRVATTISGRPAMIKVCQTSKIPAAIEASSTMPFGERLLGETAQWLVSADLDLGPFYRIVEPHPIMGPIAKALRVIEGRRPNLKTMPWYRELAAFQRYETDMRDALQEMGVHLVFSDSNTLLSMAPNRSGGKLRGVAQKTEITVDGDGIRADSGTISGGVYGGIMMVREPFHMTLNRPFVFLIRDTVTHALLFIGAVMNPKEP